VVEKIFVVGSIKIDSRQRRNYFLNNLASLEPISPLLSWNFNIAGKYSEDIRREVLKRYKEADVALDDESSYYEIVKKQISFADKKALLFFLMEDHWLVCPHKNLFFYLLEEFRNSEADALRITHLIEFWERENAYKLIVDKPLYKEYFIDQNVLLNLWQKYPGAYVTSLPGIFKKEFALEILENNKSLLNSKKPGGFELFGKKAEEFLAKRSFVTMVPTFHVFREVFGVNHEDRSMDVRKALKIIKLRDTPDTAIKPWRGIIRLIMEPRVLLGRIKRKIKK
jgi:hypothetical protein